jgi:hypothetical protein
MSGLSKYAGKSPIMNIKIRYKDEIFKFNLNEEMRVDEGHVNQKIKSHIRGHAFLNVLAVKLKIQYSQAKKALARHESSLLMKFKEKGRTIAEAESLMYKKHPELQKQEDELLALEEFKDTIDACLKSFEMRKDLLQSLSANVRRENK